MERHPGFFKPYRKLIHELKDLSPADSLLALAVIKRLSDKKDAFFVSLRTRLQWAYVERMNKKWLNDLGHNLATDADSALYLYTAGLYAKDSQLQVTAKHLGFVKTVINTNGEEDEVIDWKIIYRLKWNNPKVLEYFPVGLLLENPSITPRYYSSIYHFRRATEKAPSEPFYLEEWIKLLALSAPYNELHTAIKTILSQHIDTFSPTQQRKLKRIAKKLAPAI